MGSPEPMFLHMYVYVCKVVNLCMVTPARSSTLASPSGTSVIWQLRHNIIEFKTFKIKLYNVL
jgi:hypothetical protein